MYQTNLRVPLVVALPGRLAPGMRVKALVESVDIVPTVCALLGVVPPPERVEGSIAAPSNEDRERIDGVDLLPLVRGEVTSVKAFGHSENGLYLGIQDGAPSSAPDAPRYKLVVRTESLDEAAWQASLAGHPERPQLYRLDTDPGETKNLIDEEPAQAARLLEALRAFDKTMPIPRSDVAPSARDIEEEKARLKSLGYADGIGQGAGANVGGDAKRQ
jgi:arylsulfatase A-like enzyme